MLNCKLNLLSLFVYSLEQQAKLPYYKTILGYHPGGCSFSADRKWVYTILCNWGEFNKKARACSGSLRKYLFY